MPVAYSYIRFSTPEQAKGDSLRRQLDLSERYAIENNLTLDTSLRDPGRSGRKGEHLKKGGALGSFIETIKDGKVKPGSFLLVESLDRLSRLPISEALNLFTTITNAGITIVTLIDRQVYSKKRIDEDRGISLIISITIMVRAWEESEIKAERVGRAWNQKVERARTGDHKLTSMCPHWLELSTDRKTFKKKASAVALVRKIFTMIQAGHGVSTIEIKFNKERVPFFGKSNHWNRSYIKLLLRNRAVLGEYQPMTGSGGQRKPKGDPIKIYYPRIIEDTQFYAVQQILDAKKHAASGRKGKCIPNLLSGLCRCGYCGGPMVYAQRTATTSYLVCSAAKRGIEGCQYVSWRYSEIELYVLYLMQELKVETLISPDNAGNQAQLIAAQGRVEELSRAQHNLVSAIELAPDILPLVSRLSAVVDDLSKATDEVKRLDLLQSAVPPQQRIADLASLRHELAVARNQELYSLRLRIGSELKQIIDVVKFFPAGFDHKHPDTLSQEEAKFHGVDSGRNHRYFTVRFKSGKQRIIFVGAIEQAEGVKTFAVDDPFSED